MLGVAATPLSATANVHSLSPCYACDNNNGITLKSEKVCAQAAKNLSSILALEIEEKYS
jgi:hypothetical protein